MTDYFAGGEGRLRPDHAAVALIVVGAERHYLMQLRDQKAGIFYPGHWGLFGGAAEAGETQDAALLRELREEIGLDAAGARYFTEFEFDFSFAGFGRLKRTFYEVPVGSEAVAGLRLIEGRALKAFPARELLTRERVVPYDAFAIWLHASGIGPFRR